MFDIATFQVLLVSGMSLAVMGQLSITFSGQNNGPSGIGVTLLVLGMGLFAVGSSASTGAKANARYPYAARQAPGVTLSKPGMVSVVAGIVLSLVLVTRLAQGSTSGWDLTFWFAMMAVFVIPFAPKLRRPRLNLTPGHRKELASVLILVGVFLALNIRDLGDWYYSAIGDEYAFYQSALQISENGITKPFSQDGVYNTHPVLNSAYQGVVMTIFGRDNLGWRLASVLSIALTIPGVYVIGRTLGNRNIAAISALLFAFSHYVLAYAHTGYNNIHALAPVVWGGWLFSC